MGNSIITLKPAVKEKVLILNLRQSPMALHKGSVLAHVAKQLLRRACVVARTKVIFSGNSTVDQRSGRNELTRGSAITVPPEGVPLTVNKDIND